MQSPSDNNPEQQEIIAALNGISNNAITPEILTIYGSDLPAYYEYCKVFNRKFHFRPTAIVLCTCTEDVQAVMLLANKLNFAITVRSGGHDHEGESCATATVVIDLSKMTAVTVDKPNQVIKVQPGIRFKNLIPILENANVCIPHGTCGTVGIAGFVMGGGWGPWTRIHGMCCESLVGATIVLGNGEVKQLSPGCAEEELLWALRGGGGMSYGIVTEFVIQTFPMPPNTIKFQVEWDNSPGFSVLKLWEGLIQEDKNIELIGTNLMIMAIPTPELSVREAVHPCTFFGYYAGTEDSLKAHMREWFADLPPTSITIPNDNGDTTRMSAFDTWDRVSVQRKMLRASSENAAPFQLSSLQGPAPLQLKNIPPDVDAPAPHKISSRLVAETGWDDAGRENLIRTLQSNLLFEQGTADGLSCYTTLGAISGNYYKNYIAPKFPAGSAFPYKKRPFTIQYQAWWNQHPDIDNTQDVNNYTNRAEDWIAECRSYDFPQTNGSFISFKDASIPTQSYFLQSYTDLKRIKEKYSEDPNNRLRTRKTII